MPHPRTILITGASSGIGAALALHYAATGVNLHLQGRNAERLEKTAADCRARRATVYTKLVDVTDASAMEQWLRESDTLTPIDLVIANAGISAGTGFHTESSAQVRRIYATNINGVVNTVQPMADIMVGRKSGQIAIMSSLAGIRALPSCPAYSSSKACVRFYGESLRGSLSRHGVKVNVVCPGYITTPMTAVNTFPMPFIMSAPRAARIIASGLARNKARIAFPLRLYIPLWLISCFAVALTDPIFSRLPTKKESPSNL